MASRPVTTLPPRIHFVICIAPLHYVTSLQLASAKDEATRAKESAKVDRKAMVALRAERASTSAEVQDVQAVKRAAANAEVTRKLHPSLPAAPLHFLPSRLGEAHVGKLMLLSTRLCSSRCNALHLASRNRSLPGIDQGCNESLHPAPTSSSHLQPARLGKQTSHFLPCGGARRF